MISRRLSRAVMVFALAITTFMFIAISFDAQAQRFGGMRSFGRQSPNIMKQRQAVKPPAAAPSARQQQGATTNAGRQGAAAQGAAAQGAAARSGFSRFLAPIAGIAAGLGIAALLSSLGLSGAFLELMSSLLLIAAIVFIGSWLLRQLRRPAPRQAYGSATRAPGGATYKQTHQGATAGQAGAVVTPLSTAPSEQSIEDPSWFIPADFDVPVFLDNAKAQFARIQALWDAGDEDNLRQYLTDDLFREVSPAIQANAHSQTNRTEIVLLNAELMGIEKLEDGYLASVRYSGMLREGNQPEAVRFEEAWNLLKAEGTGWLVAGIQQMPEQH